MPSRACVVITGTGKRVAAALWNSRSYSMIQITSSRRPARTVTIQVYKAKVLIRNPVSDALKLIISKPRGRVPGFDPFGRLVLLADRSGRVKPSTFQLQGSDDQTTLPISTGTAGKWIGRESKTGRGMATCFKRPSVPPRCVLPVVTRDHARSNCKCTCYALPRAPQAEDAEPRDPRRRRSLARVRHCLRGGRRQALGRSAHLHDPQGEGMETTADSRDRGVLRGLTRRR